MQAKPVHQHTFGHVTQWWDSNARRHERAFGHLWMNRAVNPQVRTLEDLSTPDGEGLIDRIDGPDCAGDLRDVASKGT